MNGVYTTSNTGAILYTGAPLIENPVCSDKFLSFIAPLSAA